MICKWILNVWEEILEDIVKWAFLKYCTSNMLNSTEDNILWEDNAISPDSSNSSNDKDELVYADNQLYEIFNRSSDDKKFLDFKGSLYC